MRRPEESPVCTALLVEGIGGPHAQGSRSSQFEGDPGHGGHRFRAPAHPRTRSGLEEGENRERPPKKSNPVQFGAKWEIFAFIGRHGREYGIEFLCRHYGLSRSGYYAWRRRAPRDEPKPTTHCCSTPGASTAAPTAPTAAPRARR